MNNTELLLLKRAYVALLRVPPDDTLRVRSQALLAQLRDAIAAELGVDVERVQAECELRAASDARCGSYA